MSYTWQQRAEYMRDERDTAVAERDRYRQALDEIRQFAGRCWTDREATYEEFGDIATMAENALKGAA